MLNTLVWKIILTIITLITLGLFSIELEFQNGTIIKYESWLVRKFKRK